MKGATVMALAVVYGVVAVGFSASANADVILAEADAAVYNTEPDTPHGSNSYIQTWTGYAGGQRGRSYLKFPMSGLPARSEVASLTLHLYQYSAGGFVPQVNLYHVANDSWAEGGLTWNNQPYPNPNPVDQLVDQQNIGNELGWKHFDLLANGIWDYDADVADGHLSLLLRSNEGGDEQHTFYSLQEDVEPGDYRPYLELTLVPEPATLGLLSIGGLAVISRRRTA